MSKNLATLEKENREQKAQIASLKEQVAKLTAIIKLQQNQMFGKKTEIIEKVATGQQSLFSDQELAALQDDELPITEVIETREKKVVRHRKPKAKQHGQRTAFLNSLPQVDQIIHLEQETCFDCHQKMIKIGQHLYSREPRLKPAELFCVNYYQESYRCPTCEDRGKDKIVSSQMP